MSSIFSEWVNNVRDIPRKQRLDFPFEVAFPVVVPVQVGNVEACVFNIVWVVREVELVVQRKESRWLTRHLELRETSNYLCQG